MFYILLLFYTFLIGCVVSVSANTDGQRYKRIAYDIPLIKLSLKNNGTAMRVFKQGNDDYAIIALLDDKYVKNTKKKTMQTVFKESEAYAHYISDFESEHILLATLSLEKTLNNFERYLKQHHWGQCVYLDAFLPRFLHNFYLLIGIAGNRAELYNKYIRLFEDKYEVSLNSQLSDDRIDIWESNEELLMKLRIVSKELAHCLEQWAKKDLSGKKRNPEMLLSHKVEETLNLFIKIYFNLTTP